MNVMSSLALVMALGLSGIAGAVELSVSGQGQALIYPIYSVEGGNDTAIHITNTGSFPSVAKVRILQALTGEVAYSFNLYLNTYDVWTGVLVRSDTGTRLMTADPSCTLPLVPAEGIELGNNSDPLQAARTRVGTIEVIEMGALNLYVSPAAWDLIGFFDSGNCAGLPGAFAEGGLWAQDSHNGLIAPRGQLSGSVTITNVMNGHQVGLDATALTDFSQQPRQTRPEDPQPTLGQSETSYATMRGVVVPFRNGVEAVTALLTRMKAEGDFAYGAGLNAETDWVVTFPTKAYLNALTTPDAAGERYSPFVTTPGPGGLACETADTAFMDRNGGSRRAVGQVDLCAIANIVGIGDSDILGGQQVRARLPAPSADTGWLSLSLLGRNEVNEWSSYKRFLTPTNAPGPIQFEGLATIGFSITRIQNGDVGGLLSNYVSVKELTSPPNTTAF